MKIKKPMFKLKATMLAVLMATSTSINAIDADVKTDLLARYPNMNTLSDAQLQKVVDLLNRFPGLKNLNQKDIDSIKERIEERRASGNRVLGSGKVVKKLIEIKPDLLANIDPGRFRKRLSRSADGRLSIRPDLTTLFDNLSKEEIKQKWTDLPMMEKIAVLKAFNEYRGTDAQKENRAIVNEYIYENKFSEDDQKKWDDWYAQCTPDSCSKAKEMLQHFGGEWDDKNQTWKDGKEPNWAFFWMMLPEQRQAFYQSLSPSGAHFDKFANPDEHNGDAHKYCSHEKNKFWDAFALQYPMAWQGWFKENIWAQVGTKPPGLPGPKPENWPPLDLKQDLIDWIKAKWPPLPPDLEMSKEILIGLIENAKPGFELPGEQVGNELPDPNQELQDWLDQNAISGDRFKNLLQLIASLRPEPGEPDGGEGSVIDIGNELPDPNQELQDWLDQNAISGDRFKNLLQLIASLRPEPGEPDGGEGSVIDIGNELPDVPDSIPERPVSELDRDKIQNLIDYLQNRPGWEPLPPLLEANMDDLITLLQGYQRVETPNAEELLRRSKKTSGGS